ncbi:MAG: galactokinase family protein [Gammaproteobacteria bacterium]
MMETVATAAVLRFRVPGRVELVGKHVDYGGGRSLTCATAAGLQVTARFSAEPRIRVRSRQHPDEVLLPLADGLRHPGPAWGVYVGAVVRRLTRDFPTVTRGVDLDIDSDLPDSAGLSSSSALVVACALALVAANGLRSTARWRDAFPDVLAEAEYFGAMESGTPCGPFAGDDGVGVRGGAQDPIAILCSRENAVGQYGYLPARMEGFITWPATHRLVIGVSGVQATKTREARVAYNRLSDALRGKLPASPWVEARRAQFHEEVAVIVPGVASALHAADWPRLGRLVDRSQELAETVLGNQVPETIQLQRLARDGGAIAASAFGAGFGGAVWAMVAETEIDHFMRRWQVSYLAHHPERIHDCRFFAMRPAGPAGPFLPDTL